MPRSRRTSRAGEPTAGRRSYGDGCALKIVVEMDHTPFAWLTG